MFPRSLIEFQRRFPTDEACGEYLVAVRWPRGFCCPACGHDRGWRLERRLPTFECAGCDRQIAVTAGTVMHRSHLPLTTWFWAAYLMATHSNGISALQLQGQLGIGSYKTAWLLAHKLRRAMVDPASAPGRPGRDRRDQPAAAGEGRSAGRRAGTLRQGQDAGRRGRGDRGPQAQTTATGSRRRLFGQEPAHLRRKGRGPGRGPSQRRLEGLSRRPGGRPRPQNKQRDGRPPRPALDPSRLQQPQAWAFGTYHGLRRQHLQAYLDEFTFRFNRRHDRHAAFHRLLGLATALPHASYQMLVSRS